MVVQAQFFCFSVMLAMTYSSPLSILTLPTSNDLHATRSDDDAHHNSSVLESVCYSMTPYHDGSIAQLTPAPYTMTVSKKNATPGETLQVIIYGKNDTQFRGIYIQGRNGDIPVGHFLPSGPNTPNVTLTDCPPGKKNTASYISRKPISQLILSFVVPKNVPAVIFRATFVQSLALFWTDVVSEEILVA